MLTPQICEKCKGTKFQILDYTPSIMTMKCIKCGNRNVIMPAPYPFMADFGQKGPQVINISNVDILARVEKLEEELAKNVS